MFCRSSASVQKVAISPHETSFFGLFSEKRLVSVSTRHFLPLRLFSGTVVTKSGVVWVFAHSARLILLRFRSSSNISKCCGLPPRHALSLLSSFFDCGNNRYLRETLDGPSTVCFDGAAPVSIRSFSSFFRLLLELRVSHLFTVLRSSPSDPSKGLVVYRAWSGMMSNHNFFLLRLFIDGKKTTHRRKRWRRHSKTLSPVDCVRFGQFGPAAARVCITFSLSPLVSIFSNW